jgi:hypothetical protein
MTKEYSGSLIFEVAFAEVETTGRLTFRRR